MLRTILLKLGFGRLGAEIRAAAEGKRGAKLKAFYWWLAGIKTVTGFILAIATVALLALGGYDNIATFITGPLSALLISTGLIDKGWRSRPPSWETRRVWMLLRGWWPEVTVVLAALGTKLTTCTSELASSLGRVHLTCQSAYVLVTVVVAIGGWALGEAKLTEGPKELPGR